MARKKEIIGYSLISAKDQSFSHEYRNFKLFEDSSKNVFPCDKLPKQTYYVFTRQNILSPDTASV